MVIKIKASQKGALKFDLRFESLLKFEVEVANQKLKAKGYAPYEYKGGKVPSVKFDETRGIHFLTLYEVSNTDGIMNWDINKLQ